MLEPLISKINDLKVILASSSPQRATILRSVNIKFDVVASKFEENLQMSDHNFSEYVEKTATGKVLDVAKTLKSELKTPDLIIGVDTMVACDGKFLGKPKDFDEAVRTVKLLTQSRLPNYVYTGLAIWYKEQIYNFTEVTTVHMMYLSDEEIKSYVKTGEPMGKAGAYGIQGIAGTFVERIEGDYNNVIGLPLCRLAKELKKIIYV